MECNRGINLAFRLDFTIPSRFARLSTYTIIYNTQRTNPTNQHRNIASVKPWPPGDGGFARASTFNVDKAQLAVDHHRTTPSRKKLCPPNGLWQNETAEGENDGTWNQDVQNLFYSSLGQTSMGKEGLDERDYWALRCIETNYQISFLLKKDIVQLFSFFFCVFGFNSFLFVHNIKLAFYRNHRKV